MRCSRSGCNTGCNNGCSMKPKAKFSRQGPLLVLVGGLAIGCIALVAGMRRRPASLDNKGQFDAVLSASGAFAVQLPAFLTRVYGGAKLVGDASVIGARAGNPDRGNFVVVALSKPDAFPFVGLGFEDWVGDAYLDCLATADSTNGRNWWASQANEELQAQPYKMKFSVAKNTIPLVSRVCLAVTNTMADVNVRIYGAFTGLNYDRFADDLRAMVTSLKVDEARARQHLGIGVAPKM